MDLDFPANPNIGDIHSGAHGHEWMWDGIKWVAMGAGDGVIGAAFLPIVGGTMQGPIVLPAGTLAAPPLSFGNASGNVDGTGISRSGNAIAFGVGNSMVLGLFVGSAQFYGPVGVLNNRITQVADATAATDALNQRAGDARYLQSAGGQMTGPLIAQNGSSNTNLGLAFGDNATGFWRTGNFVILSVGGGTQTQFSPTETQTTVRLNMSNQQIQNLGAPSAAHHAVNQGFADARYVAQTGGAISGALSVAGTLDMLSNRIAALADATAATDALNLRTGDARYSRASSLLTVLPSNVGPITSSTFINLAPITYAIPRGGNSRIMVNVSLNCSAQADAQIQIGGVRLDLFPAAGVRNAFLYQVVGNACADLSGQFVVDVSGTSTGPFNVQVALIGGAASGFNVLAGSQITVVDLGPTP